MSEKEQEMVRELDALTEEQKIAKVKSVVKQKGWKMFLDENSKNFHVIGDNGIRIQREEYQDLLKGTVINWSFIQNGKRVISSFGNIIVFFCQAVVEEQEIMCVA